MTYYIDYYNIDKAKEKINKMTFQENAFLYLISSGYKIKDISYYFDIKYTNLKERFYALKKRFNKDK